jgi:eukaryotic-like serine/threonine-protein kinase
MTRDGQTPGPAVARPGFSWQDATVAEPSSPPEDTPPASESGEESIDSLVRNVARAPAVGGKVTLLLSPGSVIAGYRLRRNLGEGGMGVVWEAEHVGTGTRVAMKFLKRADPDEGVSRRFLREARAARAVKHPSVVAVHDVLELEDGCPVMVMELLQGETLADRLARQSVIALPELAPILVDVCAAVGCAHSLGIVHRDLKPENIFLVSSPEGRTVKVLDFGLAKLTADDGDAARTAGGGSTGAGVLLGTLLYMAPEQLRGEKGIDHRVDIWALGTIMYEALSGSTPARTVAEIYRVVLLGAMVPLGERAPHLPPSILDLVDRMLSHDRQQRPGDIREVVDVLSGYTPR